MLMIPPSIIAKDISMHVEDAFELAVNSSDSLVNYFISDIAIDPITNEGQLLAPPFHKSYPPLIEQDTRPMLNFYGGLIQQIRPKGPTTITSESCRKAWWLLFSFLPPILYTLWRNAVLTHRTVNPGSQRSVAL